MVVLDIILALMKENGISQKELCEKIGVNKQAFTNWKNGTHSSYKKYLPQIADAIGVSVDYLLGKSDEKEKSPSVSDEDLKFALFGGDKEIPDEVLDEVKRFAAYAKERYGKK